MTLPAICMELRLRSEGGVAVVNSRDVAELFEKRHAEVLREIDELMRTTTLANLRFIPAEHRGAKGEDWRSFDVTRQGFTQLVTRWTGERAARLQFRYIEAFDAMEWNWR